MPRGPARRRGAALTNRAFPNAYLEVDEPPRRTRQRALALAGLLGTAWFILTVTALHLEPTGYNPVTQTVSDYGVGKFAAAMDLGFFSGGAGLFCIALALGSGPGRQRGTGLRAGATLLLVAGIALFLVGLFPTDLEGTPGTAHGAAHGLLSLAVFTLGPAGMIVLARTQDHHWLLATLGALGVAAASLVINAAFALDANGLAERAVIAVVFGWCLGVAYLLFRDPSRFETSANRWQPAKALREAFPPLVCELVHEGLRRGVAADQAQLEQLFHHPSRVLPRLVQGIGELPRAPGAFSE